MKILLVNQCFYPDVAATAQYMSEMACALTERGHRVSVIASSRGYDDSSLRFPRRERWNGIEIFRVPCLATGKGSRSKRGLNIVSFFVTCFARLLFMPRFDVVVALTSPPLISVLPALFVRLRGGRFIYWIMDLNPDEAIAAGWLNKDSRVAHLLEAVFRYSAHAADRIFVLDRFMHDRVVSKGLAASKLATLPPWSLDSQVWFDSAGREEFRARHSLTGKFVVMYSGNHSPCHPLDTILNSALQLAARPDIAFCFVGGGSEHAKVRTFALHHKLRNVICLPYQPIDELAASLSSADLHLVVLGTKLAGLVHPSKVYNIMAVGVPILFVGPSASHVGDIAAAHPDLPIAQIEHGNVAGTVAAIASFVDDRTNAPIPNRRMRDAAQAFSAARIIPQYAAVIEGADISEPIPEAHAVLRS